ncbi:MAG: DUF3060 domain-containing protein [Myxococcota bacterium]
MLLVPLALAGDTFAIAENNRTVAYACKPDGVVQVLGNGNSVTLTGPCDAVSVTGNDNTVHTEMARTITVAGNQNGVSWQRGVGKDPPRVQNLGNGNKVARKQ